VGEKAMAKAKLSVTVEEELVDQIHEMAALQSQPLSNLVESALKQFLAAQLEAEMEEGYRVMAEFDLALAKTDMAAGFEVLPDV
jgi:predicted transcriptional regulator